MGKSQVKKKTRAARHNPMRVPDAHLGGGKGDGKADPVKAQQMLPVLNKMRSEDLTERTWACAAVCNLIQNDPATRRLFQGRNVVGLLIERLSDDVIDVVVEASGALRNLGIDGGHELCGEMFNKGIMSHLTVLVAKVATDLDQLLSPGDDTFDREQRIHLLSLAENIITLLWLLGEVSSKALQAVNAAGVEVLLIKCIGGREVVGKGVAVAAAQAAYSLSQDNRTFRMAVTQLGALPTLIRAARGEGLLNGSGGKKGKGKATLPNGDVAEDDALFRLLVGGLLRNLVLAGSRTDKEVDITSITHQVILPIINQLLELKVESVVRQVTELVAQVPQQDPTAKLGKHIKLDHRSSPEIALDKIETTLNTVATALEILTGICAGIEDETLDENGEVQPEAAITVDVDEEEDEAMEGEAFADDGEAWIAGARDTAGEVDTSLPKLKSTSTIGILLKDLRLPRRLAHLTVPSSLSFPPPTDQPSLHPPTTSLLSMIHLRALEALSNIYLTLVAMILAGQTDQATADGTIGGQASWETLFGVVTMLGQQSEALSKKGQEMRQEILEALMGCLWGVGKISSASLTLPTSHVQTLIDTYPFLRSDISRTRLIDTLALLASRQTVPVAENQAVGVFLLRLLSQNSAQGHARLDDETLIAVIDAVIDIYADEEREYDGPVFVQGGFLAALTGAMGRVKAQMRGIDRRKDQVLRGRGEEAAENLAAFIKYRRSLGR